MQINHSVGPTPTPASLSATGEHPSAAEIGKETFLRLLIAQLEHQDPLSPIENAEFTAQLAQFNSLEQMEAVNTNLKSLLAAQEAASGVQATALIGKAIKANGNTTRVRQGEATTLHYHLPGDSARVVIDVFSDDGRRVRTIEGASQPAGDQVVPWDTKNAQGVALPDGTYTFTVSAVNNQGVPIEVDPYIQGIVEGVEIVDNRPFLRVDGNRIELTSLISVGP